MAQIRKHWPFQKEIFGNQGSPKNAFLEHVPRLSVNQWSFSMILSKCSVLQKIEEFWKILSRKVPKMCFWKTVEGSWFFPQQE